MYEKDPRTCAKIFSTPYTSRTRWSVGIDIGQSFDPTAFCAVEAVFWQMGDGFQNAWRHPRTGAYVTEGAPKIVEARPKNEARVRGLQRLPLGASYVEQCERLAALLSNPELAEAKVFLDATGVGKPVADLFKAAGIKHTPVWITGGREEQPHDSGGFTVPKLLLISRLQAALHSGELKIAAKLPEAAAFTRELQEFRVSWTDTVHAQFGARQGRSRRPGPCRGARSVRRHAQSRRCDDNQLLEPLPKRSTRRLMRCRPCPRRDPFSLVLHCASALLTRAPRMTGSGTP